MERAGGGASEGSIVQAFRMKAMKLSRRCTAYVVMHPVLWRERERERGGERGLERRGLRRGLPPVAYEVDLGGPEIVRAS